MIYKIEQSYKRYTFSQYACHSIKQAFIDIRHRPGIAMSFIAVAACQPPPLGVAPITAKRHVIHKLEVHNICT